MKNTKAAIVRKYIVRFPNTPSLTLAKKIYAENTLEFKDVDAARSSIRYQRGLNGEKNRKSGDKKLHVKLGKFTTNPFRLPNSYAQKQRVFHLPKDRNNVLLISDLHIPYHDNEAITMAIKYGQEKKINCIIINGDLLDFYQISRFVNVERKRSVKDELETARELLSVLNKVFPSVPIYMTTGNHDSRLEKYLAVKAPEILDMDEFKLEVLLDAALHNMIILKETTLLRVGKLAVTHGHMLLRGGFVPPVNAARGTFLRAKASTLISHVHKVSTHSETTIHGKTVVCYSTGCLCELTPDYTPFANNYSLGFAHIMTEPNGNFKVKNLQIVDGAIVN